MMELLPLLGLKEGDAVHQPLSLTGYAGGIDKKERLLRLEGVDTKLFSAP